MAERVAGVMTCTEVDDLAAAFVLGALDDDEMDDVRQHLAGCPNEHADFSSLGSVVPALLETIEPVEPRAELGARIMDVAREERASRIESAWRPTAATQTPATDVLRISPATRRRAPLEWVALAAAAAIVIAALGVWNLQLRGQVDELAAYRQAVAGVIDRAANGGQVAILENQLKSNAVSPRNSGIAGIGTDGSVAVAMTGLAPTAGTEVYEVWVIGGNGTPVALGSFTVGVDNVGGTVTATGPIEPGVTVALTREPAAGATTPTLPIVALGTAKAPGS